MPVTIKAIEPGSLADRLGWKPGEEIVLVNGQSVADEIDFRFQTAEEVFTVKRRTRAGLVEEEVEREDYQPLGVELEEFRIRTCGDDCVFCFVDQNPEGLRQTIYFRDSDFRMSFLYGNYITVMNLRERDLERIVEQNLSPMYISVHCTDDEIRSRMMGHKGRKDRLMEKLRYLYEHEIEVHTQIVLVPGYNDGEVLRKTMADLYEMHETLLSVAIVPVGLTNYRKGLTDLRGVSPAEARALIAEVQAWQARFREEIGRGFVYLSDEFFLLAGLDFPQEDEYDGFPLIENGVGMSRDFLNELAFQREDFPDALPVPKKVTMVTGTLAAPILQERVKPVLETIGGLTVEVVVAENTLFGPAVTVSGLLSGRCFETALRGRDLGDLVLFPPDCLNFDGIFLDDLHPDDLEARLGVPIQLYNHDWVALLDLLIGEPAGLVPGA